MREAAANHLPALTGFRFLAASLVFLAHHAYAVPAGAPPLVHYLAQGGYMGVSLFFVLSGYLIARQNFFRPLDKPADFFRYFGARLARIFPFYLLVLLGLHLRWQFGLPELFLHATLLKGYSAKYLLAGVVQAWTLTVELTFYLLAPLLFYLIRKYSLLRVYLLTLLTGVLLTGLGAYLFQQGHNPYGFLADFRDLVLHTFFGRATEFFAGMHLFLWCSRNKPGRTTGGVRMPATLAGGLLFVLCYLFISAQATPASPGIDSPMGLLAHHLLLPLALWGLLYGLITERSGFQRLLASPLLVALGHASYIFYLIHLGWIRNWFIHHLTHSPILLFLLLWGLSWGLHRALERPLYSWLKRRIQGAAG